MNKLPLQTRVQILNMLVEGSSMRSISRVADVSINTVTKLLVDAGTLCERFHDETVRGLKTTTQLQADEIWAFCGSKKRNVPKDKKGSPDFGDIWTFTCLDRDSKLMVTWLSGQRNSDAANIFIKDALSRIDDSARDALQLTTDGFTGYKYCVDAAFAERGSYAQLNKTYTNSPNKSPEARYSPGVCIAAKKEIQFGEPDVAMISTSHVERSNLSMRMGMRRFTRLTNAFSKKYDNHCHALALYFFHYNFCRIHKSLRTSPAQAAGVTDDLLSMEDVANMIDAANPSKKRGPYKKAQAEA